MNSFVNEQKKGNVQMNTIVREMNPAEEIELTDTQLSAVYGAWDEQCQSQSQYQCQSQSQAQPVCQARPICQEQEKSSSSVLVQKKVVIFVEEDFSLEKNEAEQSYSSRY